MAPYCFSCHTLAFKHHQTKSKKSKLNKMTTTDQLSTIINCHTSAYDVLMMLCCALFTIIIYLLTTARFSPMANIFRSAEPPRPSRCNIVCGYYEEARIDYASKFYFTCLRIQLSIHKNLSINHQPPDQHPTIQPSYSTNPSF